MSKSSGSSSTRSLVMSRSMGAIWRPPRRLSVAGVRWSTVQASTGAAISERTWASSVRRCSSGCRSSPSNRTCPPSSSSAWREAEPVASARFPVFEQGAAGGAADLDGQLLIAQAQIPLKHAPCLQGQCAQANGECAAHAHARVGQGIHDAGIAQRLAAAGRRHVDDERTLALRALTHAGGQVGRLVLPLESWIGIALFRPR